jgi:hypothetical protein
MVKVLIALGIIVATVILLAVANVIAIMKWVKDPETWS